MISKNKKKSDEFRNGFNHCLTIVISKLNEFDKTSFISEHKVINMLKKYLMKMSMELMEKKEEYFITDDEDAKQIDDARRYRDYKNDK
jgi:transcription initiation factor TFIID subunit TAF12